MSVLVKFCGITTPEIMEYAVALGVEHVGLIFHAASPRNVSLGKAVQLAEIARGRSAVVAVVVDPGNELVESIITHVQPEFLQLHGTESPTRVEEIKRRFRVKILKALSPPFFSTFDYALSADALLLDAPVPGSGKPFDWSLLQGFRSPLPWFLSGGLTPENVAEAIRITGAKAVDVSSGIERERGVKDPELMHQFIESVRNA